jgi:hypothetical protein
MERSWVRNGLYFLVLMSAVLATQAGAATDFTSVGDLNGDGVINRSDVFLLLKGFDPHGVTLPTEADRNGDNVADQKDLDLFLLHWRQGRPHSDITPPDPAACGTVEGHVYIVNEAGEQIPVQGSIV